MPNNKYEKNEKCASESTALENWYKPFGEIDAGVASPVLSVSATILDEKPSKTADDFIRENPERFERAIREQTMLSEERKAELIAYVWSHKL